MPQRAEWLDDDEYPSEDDMEEFGDYSPRDDHPLTIGNLGYNQPPTWTPRRLLLAAIALLIVAAMLLPVIAPLLR